MAQQAVPKVIKDCVPNLLLEWQSNLISPLSRDAQRTGLPFDITKAKLGDITGPKPQS